ncbi:conserved hypothetical protein of the DUF526 family [Candidatus Kinetoplastibacterium blastocrithidii TCC012E]|uniref:Uncharacterized protein n=1 Tax=Candidatus Kinetoplastidibacterium blastocrithidiae TCC012E TaxID=1208922 RepID=M1LB99_9PROT|nr:accessory factor UbiK family protein [Candidatus Kinetoplastibacterium blastocrithidii]AFZ83603.1 hypothetical protein CKBE_00414 [Candidatus Kinetoplastibacterium blastocrithidii (ex Strigomonas culicis)]AGF49723.1 conserved hypothetical protein of the DUF526 family [Candidatus Kinetoplastibacterium blastocrithidii TCC012E]
MKKNKWFEGLQENIGNSIVSGASSLKKDIENGINLLVNNAVSKLDLVTNEELESQVEILEFIREEMSRLNNIIENLELRIEELENNK